jgi:anti-anti-sigma factor
VRPSLSLPAGSRLLEFVPVGSAVVVRFTTPRLLSEGPVLCVAWELDRLLEGGCKHCVLNLLTVEAMDSLMMAKLIGLRRKVHALGGQLTLCGIGPRLMPWFERTRLAQVFHIATDEQEALRAT